MKAASILIVSKNRKLELKKTISILADYINLEHHELLVFLDGSTDGSEKLQEEFAWVSWYESKKSIGASRARRILYKKAVGNILIGFDDDAHPLQPDFIQRTIHLFESNPNLGIIGFKEIKGIYESDSKIPPVLAKVNADFLTNEFLGCGFAIKKEVYDLTRGFPEWIDIYGEETSLSLETMDLGYSIMSTSRIMVNHRIDRSKRSGVTGNYFRFQKQLKNTSFIYLVYYPFPLILKKILKLYLHNLKKYGFKDKKYFKSFFLATVEVIRNIPKVLQYRKVISEEKIRKFYKLSPVKF